MVFPLTYILTAGLYISILYVAFIFAVKKNYNFNAQRLLILASVGLGLFFPMLQFSFLNSTTQEYSYLLPLLEIGQVSEAIATSNSIKGRDLTSIVSFIFLLAGIIGLIRFAYGCFQLFSIIKNGKQTIFEGKQVIFSSKIKAPCSFWKYILVPKNFELHTASSALILQHEREHIRLLHSLDNIVFSLLQIVFWWLPTFYWWQQRLKLTHEYEVDYNITKNQNPFTYANFLIEQVPIHQKLLHTNNFYSCIKKRIQMMYQEKKSKSPIFKYAIYALTIPLLIVIQSFQSSNFTNLTLQTNDNSYEETIIDTIFEFDPVTNKEKVQYVKRTRNVYKKADQMPILLSCLDKNKTDEELKMCNYQKILGFVGSNLKYPEEAKKAKLEGKLICEFVITDQGKMDNFKILRPIGFGTSEAVLQTLEKMQKSDFQWQPGMVDGQTVNVSYTLPVKFSLQ